MEEDIKRLEETINYWNNGVEVLENILTRYKEKEEIIKKLDKNMFVFSNKVAKDYIPKSKVKEKIEELNEYYKKEIYPSLLNWSDIDITEHYDNMIALLQELLEREGK